MLQYPETRKFLDQAQRSPLVVRSGRRPAFLVRPVTQDDLADEVVTASPKFRASIRRARRNRAAGKGLSLTRVRDIP